jgi:hypothetical protein
MPGRAPGPILDGADDALGTSDVQASRRSMFMSSVAVTGVSTQRSANKSPTRVRDQGTLR